MIIHARPSPNWDARAEGAAIDMLVLHYTGMTTAAAALARLTDGAARVSAHYLIDEDGTTWRLVDDERRAWHAGHSFWRGWTDINSRSIGIELVNPGHEFGYRPFPEAQMAALAELAAAIVRRHAIPRRNVVGHSDIAPRRKADPGELFDWPRLAAVGIGLWPGDGGHGATDVGTMATQLAAVGYEVRDLAATVRAFQRHFRPAKVDGRIDAETAGRLAVLADLIAGGPDAGRAHAAAFPPLPAGPMSKGKGSH